MEKNIINKEFWITPKPNKSCPDFLAAYGLWIFSWHQEYIGKSVLTPSIKREFQFYSISHMYDGNGYFISENVPQKNMQPGDAVLIGPNVKHGYGALKDSIYEEDSLAFFGPLADHMAKSGMIANDVVHIGKARKLLPIIELLKNPSVTSQYQANMLLQQLLLDIFLRKKDDNDSRHLTKIDALRRQMQQSLHHNWSLSEMADYCNLSTVHFRRIFFDATGVLPKDYLLRLKLNYAAELILERQLSIGEISRRIGVSDQFYFCKIFKKQFGLPPSKY